MDQGSARDKVMRFYDEGTENGGQSGQNGGQSGQNYVGQSGQNGQNPGDEWWASQQLLENIFADMDHN